MSSDKFKGAFKGRPKEEPIYRHGKSKLKHTYSKDKPESDRSAELVFWFDRLKMPVPESLTSAAYKESGRHIVKEPSYNVLSQPVRHELNKYFYDVNSNPSKAQRKQLWFELQMIDPASPLPLSKIVRWFQNKRAYVKRQYGRDQDHGIASRAAAASRSSFNSSDSECEVGHGSSSESESD